MYQQNARPFIAHLRELLSHLLKEPHPFDTVASFQSGRWFVNETGVRADWERRGSMCPQCQTVRGIATTNTVSLGLQRIAYRCPTCGQSWEHAYQQKPERLHTGR